MSTPVDTPAIKTVLGHDLEGQDASRSINYSSVVGMLLYLGHSHPDKSFATHQCAWYTHIPKQSHKDAIGTYRALPQRDV